MDNVLKGMISGFAATVALSVIMVMKSALGLAPELNIIAMLSGMLGVGPLLGWITHFLIGVVLWGLLFATLEPRLPSDRHWLNGVMFGVGAWLLMMTVFMPLIGTGFFGMQLGITVPIMTFLLHVIYGAVLGSVYAEFQLPRLSLQLAHR